MEKRVVVVTGASGNIGLGITRRLVSEGFSVAAVVNQSNPFSEEPPHNLKVARADFSDPKSVDECAKAVITDNRSIYGLVNCAGVAYGAPALMTPRAELERIFAVNYFSTVAFTQKIVKRMIRAKEGAIVNIASTAATLSDKGTLAYGASKAAMLHSTRVMAAEFGAYGIRVNAVTPAVVKTRMGALMDEEAINALIDRAFLSGDIEVADVVDSVCFLLSDRARSITGQSLVVDRGITV